MTPNYISRKLTVTILIMWPNVVEENDFDFSLNQLSNMYIQMYISKDSDCGS